MFIKKVGYLLLVRLKLFRILAILSPLAMFLSLFSMFFMLHLKEEYKFQEPSLKTKIFDVSSASSSQQIGYQSIFDGVKIAQIDGLLNNQCFLVTFPSGLEDSQQVKTIYNTISHQSHISKNVVLLGYHSQKQLNRFFEWYYDSKVNKQTSFGIIRAGINLEIKRDNSEQKDKAYLKTYTSTLHADLDFFQACKELLEKMMIQWSPCEQVHRWPLLRTIRQGLSNLQQLLLKERQLRIFYDHLLCELSEHLSYQQSAHEIMMKNGFQAVTVKFIVSSSQQKVQKFVVSLLNEFGMQQDHLHSANTLYYPISKSHFAPLLLFLTPSLIFFVALVFHLLDPYIAKYYKQTVSLDLSVPLMAYVMLSEQTMTNDYSFSMHFAGLLMILSIGRDIITIFKKTNSQMRHCQIALLALSGLISIYFGVFCYALSHLTIMLTLIMLFKPQNIISKLATKITFIILSFLWLYSNSWQQLLDVSVQLKLIMIVFVIYLSL